MATTKQVEDLGFRRLSQASSDVGLLTNVGAFGINMVAIGAGLRVLSSHREAGVDLVKLGLLLCGVGYGVRILATGESPKDLLPKL
jgi:hypothetical protein